MNHPVDFPADTRMMPIVHDALRRDLNRAVDALSGAPDAAQSEAIAAHVVWMADFLEAHHHGEDAALWPAVVARDPRAAAIVEAMAAEHARVEPLIAACRAAAEFGLASHDATRGALLATTVALRDELFAHLEREEQEMLPVAAAALTAGEWNRIEHEQFIAPKETPKLAMEAHWLRDGLDADRSDYVMRQVSYVARQVIERGYARRYRRAAIARWGDDRRAREQQRTPYGPYRSRRTIASTLEVHVVVPAPIDAVWAVVSDVTRVGEWSGECRTVVWLDGATAPAPGVRFAGSNRAGRFTWTRVNEVLSADAPHTLVWRTVPTARYPDSSEWTIDLRPVPAGTQITQSYRLLKAPRVLKILLAMVVPSHRDRTSELQADLTRLGHVAASEVNEQRVPA